MKKKVLAIEDGDGVFHKIDAYGWQYRKSNGIVSDGTPLWIMEAYCNWLLFHQYDSNFTDRELHVSSSGSIGDSKSYVVHDGDYLYVEPDKHGSPVISSLCVCSADEFLSKYELLFEDAYKRV